MQLNFLQLLSSDAVQRVKIIHSREGGEGVQDKMRFRGISGKVLGGLRDDRRPSVTHSGCGVSRMHTSFLFYGNGQLYCNRHDKAVLLPVPVTSFPVLHGMGIRLKCS